MGRWITNWPVGEGGKWGDCSAALAAQIAADGACQVSLVDDATPLSRHILFTPVWARPLAQRHPAVALALKLSPLDQYRASQPARPAQIAAAARSPRPRKRACA